MEILSKDESVTLYFNKATVYFSKYEIINDTLFLQIDCNLVNEKYGKLTIVRIPLKSLEADENADVE
jgi:hypothetical protein